MYLTCVSARSSRLPLYMNARVQGVFIAQAKENVHLLVYHLLFTFSVVCLHILFVLTSVECDA